MMMGWQVTTLGTRTLTVNGLAVVPPTLPVAVEGHWIIVFGAGEPSYTAWSYW